MRIISLKRHADHQSETACGSGESVGNSLNVVDRVRRSLISTLEVLVFELSRRRLNTFPSVRNRMSAPKSLSWNALLSMAENTNVNNSGAITQPCLVPFVTENGSDVCP